MTKIDRKTYRRIFMYSMFVVLMSLTITGLSKILAYFNSGADQYLNSLTKSAISEHTPRFEWSKASENLDPAIKKTIQKAYSQAWYVFNTSIENKDILAAQDYFSDGLKEKMIQSMSDQERWEIRRIDLSHHLEVDLFSLDRKLIAFTDKGVHIKKRIRDLNTSEIVVNTTEVADYDVVMILEDGNWRIRHFHKSSGETLTFEPTKISSSDSTFYACRDGQFYKGDRLFQVKGINYYPAHTPWLKFWEEFNVDTIDQDFQRITDLNLNTVRVFISYSQFGKGKVFNMYLSKLDLLVDMAEKYNLALIITLFDFPEGYSMRHYTTTDRQLKTILTRYADRDNILAWDLKNEPDRDFENYGKDEVMEWLTLMAQRAREYAPRQLITIGWSKSQYALLLNEYLDFVSFHFYDDPSLLADQLNDLRESLNNKPVMLQETGLPSSSFLFFPGGGSPQDQSDYLSEILNILNQNENTPYCIWTLYDFSEAPSSVFGWKPWLKHVQKSYGLLNSDGSLKPSGLMMKESNQ